MFIVFDVLLLQSLPMIEMIPLHWTGQPVAFRRSLPTHQKVCRQYEVTQKRGLGKPSSSCSTVGGLPYNSVMGQGRLSSWVELAQTVLFHLTALQTDMAIVKLNIEMKNTHK